MWNVGFENEKFRILCLFYKFAEINTVVTTNFCFNNWLFHTECPRQQQGGSFNLIVHTCLALTLKKNYCMDNLFSKFPLQDFYYNFWWYYACFVISWWCCKEFCVTFGEWKIIISKKSEYKSKYDFVYQ